MDTVDGGQRLVTVAEEGERLAIVKDRLDVVAV
jgi:hypothetical protein